MPSFTTVWSKVLIHKKSTGVAGRLRLLPADEVGLCHYHTRSNFELSSVEGAYFHPALAEGLARVKAAKVTTLAENSKDSGCR